MNCKLSQIPENGKSVLISDIEIRGRVVWYVETLDSESIYPMWLFLRQSNTKSQAIRLAEKKRADTICVRIVKVLILKWMIGKKVIGETFIHTHMG